MVTKKKLVESLVKYISNDLLPEIEDKHLKLVLNITKYGLLENPCIIDNFIGNSVISAILKEDEEEYDVEQFISIFKKVLDECESYPIIIPKVPLLMADDKVIRITSNDLDRIIYYLQETEKTLV